MRLTAWYNEGHPLPDRPGWYMCDYRGRVTRDHRIGLWWDGRHWWWDSSGLVMQSEPDSWCGVTEPWK